MIDKALEEPDKKGEESAEYEIQFFSTFTPVLWRFLRGSGFFRIGSGFLADPDPDFWPIRIQIHKVAEYGANLDPDSDPQH